MRIRPDGLCLPGRPDARCWACNYVGAGRLDRDWALAEYERLLELAEEVREFSINSLWRGNGKGYSQLALARKVVHDLWFHRLSEPAEVRGNGIVYLWRLK